MKRFNLFGIFFMLMFYSATMKCHAQTNEYKLIHQGNASFHAKQYDKAQTYYMKALKVNPHNTRAIFNLADTYLAKDNAQAADSLYNIVSQQEKNRQIKSMAMHNRGYIRQVQALHNPKQQDQLLRMAIDHYKQALRLNPRDNDTRYNLALCQKQLKNNKEDKEQQQQQNQQEKGNENTPQKQEQNNQQKQQPNQQDKQQTEQYLNLAKQAEKRALEKLNGIRPRQKMLEKNW